MPIRKFAREWRDVYANEIARAVHDGRAPTAHAISAWARYDAARRSEAPPSTIGPDAPAADRRKQTRS